MFFPLISDGSDLTRQIEMHVAECQPRDQAVLSAHIVMYRQRSYDRMDGDLAFARWSRG